MIRELATMVTLFAGGRGRTRSTVALPEAPKFVTGSGAKPWDRGRLSKLVMFMVDGGFCCGFCLTRSLFGSEKIETPVASVSPSVPLKLEKLLVPITTEFGVTPRVGKSPNVPGLLLKCADEKPSSGLLSWETATRIWFKLVPVPPPMLISDANHRWDVGS